MTQFPIKTFFTLSELLVVLFLIGLVCAAALPRLGVVPLGVQAGQVESATHDAFAVAGQMALATGHDLFLAWNATDAAWCIDGPSAPSHADASPIGMRVDRAYAGLQRFPVPRDLQIRPQAAHASVSSAGPLDDTTVSFHVLADGGALGPACNLSLGSRYWSLSVDRLTGRATLLREELPAW